MMWRRLFYSADSNRCSKWKTLFGGESVLDLFKILQKFSLSIKEGEFIYPNNEKQQIQDLLEKILKFDTLQQNFISHHYGQISQERCEMMMQNEFIALTDIYTRSVGASVQFKHQYFKQLILNSIVVQPEPFYSMGMNLSQLYVDLPFVVGKEVNDNNLIQDRVLQYMFNKVVNSWNDDAEKNKIFHNFQLLLGGPGQGKTTVLNTLHLTCIALLLNTFDNSLTADEKKNINSFIELLKNEGEDVNDTTHRYQNKPYPFYIKFSELESNSLSQCFSKRFAVDIKEEDLKHWFNSEKWLIIVDGLDEIQVLDKRGEAVKNLTKVIEDFPNVQFISSCRPNGYIDDFENTVKEIKQLDMVELNIARLTHLSINDKYTSKIIRNIIEIDPVQQRDRKVRINTYWGEYKKNGDPLKLATTPLHIMILHKMFCVGIHVYSNKYLLFQSFYQTIFYSINHFRNLKNPNVEYIFREIHGRIAYTLIFGQRPLLTNSIEHYFKYLRELLENDAALCDIITKCSKDNNGNDCLQYSPHIDELSYSLQYLCEEKLLLIEKQEDDRYDFVLQSMKEFMAAKHIIDWEEKFDEILVLLTKICQSPNSTKDSFLYENSNAVMEYLLCGLVAENKTQRLFNRLKAFKDQKEVYNSSFLAAFTLNVVNDIHSDSEIKLLQGYVLEGIHLHPYATRTAKSITKCKINVGKPLELYINQKEMLFNQTEFDEYQTRNAQSLQNIFFPIASSPHNIIDDDIEFDL